MFAPPSVAWRPRLFLTVVACAGIALALLATSKYGAGVSSDAARNLSTADSLLEGRGFVDMVGTPFVLWPPLYPLLLAGLSLVSAVDTFHLAWYLNAILFGANIWLSGWFLFSVFPDIPLFPLAGTVILLLSRSLLRLHANVASEPLFMTLMLGFFLASARYLAAGSKASLWMMCAAAGLAAVQRYLGVALLAVAVVVVLRREHARGLLRTSPAILVASLPFVAWIFLHNLPAAGTLFGPRELGAMHPLQNMGLALTKMLWWFLPRFGVLDWLILRPWIPLVIVGVLLAALNTKRTLLVWARALMADALWPALLFGLLYFILLAFTVVTADHLDLTSDRYYAVLLPVVLAGLFVTADRLVLAHLGRHRRTGLIATGLMLAVWSIYPIYALRSYVLQALAQGEPTNYNIANSAHFREMGVVQAAERILRPYPDAIVYTNYVNIAWFILRHPVGTLPFQDESLPHDARLADLVRSYPAWPEEPGYLVWFTPNEYHHIVAPADLETIADLTLLYQDETGQVFAVRRPAD